MSTNLVRNSENMLRLNKLTDYAVVVLGRLAREPGCVLPVSRIAESVAIPLPTASKLLKQLVASGLVTSHRGVRGGYSVDRSAERVSVIEIIEALDGPIALTACVEGADDECGVASHCPMSGNWDRVNTAIRAALECVSLAELTNPREIFPEMEAVQTIDVEDKPDTSYTSNS